MPDLLRTILQMQNEADARRQEANEQPLEPGLARLRAWQSQRLGRTYADLLDDPQYAPACRFFLSDIYAARDFSQRDQDAVRLHGLLSRYLPAQMLRLLGDVIHLNQMTNQLDRELTGVLEGELGASGDISEALYAQAYLACDNYAERRRQIELVGEILEEVCHGAKYPLVGVSLRLARLPAQKMGWFELYDFLERGYKATQPIRDVRRFTGSIYQRELRILERIYQSDPQPFDLPLSEA